MNNSQAKKHFVATISTSRTVQVFFLHNYFVIIFYFLCHIFYKTWVFFDYSKFEVRWIVSCENGKSFYVITGC